MKADRLVVAVSTRPPILYSHLATDMPSSYLYTLNSLQLLLHEILHPAQPAQVLPLLLDIYVIRDESGQSSVESSLLEVVLHQDLDLLIQLLELRPGVNGISCVAKQFGSAAAGLGEVGDIVDGEAGAVGDEVEAEGAFLAGALDEDGHVGGEGLLWGVVLVLWMEFSRISDARRNEVYLVVAEFFPVSGSDAVFRRYLDVATRRAALVDCTLCVCAAALR